MFAAWNETEYFPCFQISKQFSVRWERILERTKKIQTQMFRNLSLAREFAIMFCFTWCTREEGADVFCVYYDSNLSQSWRRAL